jgi:beta-aspartyl-peptidase (threonine type)
MSPKAAFDAASGGYSILVHGGAGDASGTRLDHQIAGCQDAVHAARALLESGASALDAVQRAVSILEDDPRFNAGTGGALTSLGTLELDAAIMDGTSLRAGAVCALPPFKNPVDVARAVLEDARHVLYSGDGAAEFARSKGFHPVEPDRMITDGARESLARTLSLNASNWAAGTVGAVARDSSGRLAVATSTGGIMGKHPGRVGDSPILGAGTYADDSRGAASATGQGEGILRVTLASRVIAAIGAGESPADACFEGLSFMKQRVAATGGMIAIDKNGRLGWARTTPSMAYALTWSGHKVMGGG